MNQNIVNDINPVNSQLQISFLDEEGNATGVCFLDNHTPPPNDISSWGITNTLAGRCYKMNPTDNYEMFDCKALAATFTYPIDHIQQKVIDVKYTKSGRRIESKRDLLLIDAPQDIQWIIFKNHFEKLRERIYKKHYFVIFGYELYPEFTKQGLIHVHGVLWLQTLGWDIGRSYAIASEWARITKGNMKAYVKRNANGTTSYAIAPVSNITEWLKYCKKEYIEKGEIFNLLH